MNIFKFFIICLCINNINFAKPVEIQDKCNIKVLTPSLQNRQTSKLKLDNGLTLYLISDEKADQSAACIAVNAGSWNNPEKYPGMAHFLEHMLFKSSKTYPKEDEFSQFITDHAGKDNAYTANDKTVYFFSINNSAFDEALDRFSHFFIDPNFLSSEVGRELHAVDQEYYKNIENDYWRKHQIFKEIGNQNHPNALFSTGNAQTLSIIPIEELESWYKTNYRPHLMTLIIYSSLKIDLLKKMAIEKFSKLQSGKTKKLEIEIPLSSENQKGHYIYIDPVKKIQALFIEWELPNRFFKDETKSAELVASVLDSSHEGSLCSELKKEGLIEGLSAEVEHFGCEHQLFELSVFLTEKGIAEKELIIQRCFDAISSLKEKSIPSYFFQENQNINKLQYQYQSRKNAFSFVQEIAGDLLYENLETYPQKTLLATDFSTKNINDVLDQLTPQNVQIYILFPKEKANFTPNKKEKWLGGQYLLNKIPEENLTAWSKKQKTINVTPPSNPYIPSKIELISDNKTPSTPIKVIDNAKGRIFIAKDNIFQLPKTTLFFHVKSKYFDGSAKSSVLMDLFSFYINRYLEHTISSAYNAGFNVSFYLDKFKLNILIDGYSEKTAFFLQELLKEINEFKSNKTDFENIYKLVDNSYVSRQKDLPYIQALDIQHKMLTNYKKTNIEKINSLKTITYDDFVNFHQNFLKNIYVEGFVYGNVTIKDVEGMWLDIQQSIDQSVFLKKDHFEPKALTIPNTDGPYLIKQEISSQGNSVLLTIDEGIFSFKKKAAQIILSKVLKDGFFTSLRSKQKTAYIAHSWGIEYEKHLYQAFIVQSSSHESMDLLNRFEAFIEDYDQDLQVYISKERFENIKLNLINQLEQEPKNILEMTKRLDYLAFEENEDFDFINKKIDALKNLTYSQFLLLSHDFLSRNNKARLAIIIDGKLPPEKRFYYKDLPLGQTSSIFKYNKKQIK
jgi:insulysin